MQLTMNLSEGQRLKVEGLAQVEANNIIWLDKMRWYAQTHAQRWGSVTSDDVRLYATSLGLYPTHHNAWGCIFKQKGWTVAGRQPSKLAGNHGRFITVWRWEGV